MIYDLDVVQFLKKIEDNSVDLIIADPPYGIDKDYGVEDSWHSIEEWVSWCDEWLAECERILSDGGSILVYGIHNYICYNQVTLYKLGLKYRRQFIWHYENGFCGNRKLPRATYEPLLWFTKGDDFFFEEMREPYKSEDRLRYKVVKKGKVWEPHPDGRIAGDVWNIPTLAGRRFRDEKVDHPSQKPLVLSERLVKHFSAPQAKVIIPFAGSGSECVASYRLNRPFVATEINSYFRKIANSRLEKEGYQPPSAKTRSGRKSVVFPSAPLVSQ